MKCPHRSTLFTSAQQERISSFRRKSTLTRGAYPSSGTMQCDSAVVPTRTDPASAMHVYDLRKLRRLEGEIRIVRLAEVLCIAYDSASLKQGNGDNANTLLYLCGGGVLYGLSPSNGTRRKYLVIILSLSVHPELCARVRLSTTRE